MHRKYAIAIQFITIKSTWNRIVLSLDTKQMVKSNQNENLRKQKGKAKENFKIELSTECEQKQMNW